MALDPAQEYEAKLIAQNREMEELITLQGSPIQKFYEDTVVFVTGASGFLGKQLIVKLLRSCKIQKIFVLMREKKNKSFQARIDDMVQDQIFQNLYKTEPDFVKRLVPVAGDISELRMGLTDDSWKLLTDEVNVIFHMAATINFVEALHTAVLTNIRGTREMLSLAHDCKKLKSFVHVSTAYAHATVDRAGSRVPEDFLEVPITPDLMVQLAEQMDKEKLNMITPGLIEGWPNTYTFTKALAEEMVRTKAGNLPLCIVRTAIVMPAFREPPGWTDRTTINGPVGLMVGSALGGLHVMYARVGCKVDMVPVDYVNNAIIAAGAETAARNARGDTNIKIYTVTRTRAPLTVNEVYKLMDTYARDYITPKVLWHGFIIITEYTSIFFLLSWLLHFIPGYLVDGVLRLYGQKPRVIRLFERAYKHNLVYSYFLTYDWQMDDDNLLQMYRSMARDDQIIFNYDVATIDILPYTLASSIGVRKYLLKDGLEGTLYGRKKAFMLRILNYIYLVLYGYVIFKVLFLFYSLLAKIMFTVTKY